ncbi:MAG: ribonuclease III [Clostridia bacterium]|nr:ribonuclease III [Clostridia bacterium]
MKKNQAEILSLINKIGIKWNNPQLLDLAMTHSSCSFDNRERRFNNNQRLEFLGDAVLELLSSDYLYHLFPQYSEGDLTKMRASMVCEASLAQLARSLNLGQCLYMGRGEEISGVRQRSSVLADSFEALLGAIYLDQGIEVVRQFLQKYLDILAREVQKGKVLQDYKTQLQELIQKTSAQPLDYVLLKESGPDHKKVFTSGVFHQGKELGQGIGSSKKEAEQQAAKQALAKLNLG